MPASPPRPHHTVDSSSGENGHGLGARVTVLGLDDGRELAFTEFGDPAGTPVFGFHGTPGSWRQIAVLDAAARAEGVRLIAPDRPGYGQSSFDPNRRLVDWPRDVEALAANSASRTSACSASRAAARMPRCVRGR